MEELLTTVETRRFNEDASVSPNPVKIPKPKLEILDDAVKVLKSEPDLEALKHTLNWLESHFVNNDASNIKAADAKSARVIFVLTTVILPTYGSVLHEAHDPTYVQVRNSLINCLGTINGIGILANRLNMLLRDHQSQPQPWTDSEIAEGAGLIALLQRMLKRTEFIHDLWNDLLSFVSVPSKRYLSWKEAIALLAGGRLLSLAAEAQDVIKDSSSAIEEDCWLAKGSDYATWLGSSIKYMIIHVEVGNCESRKAALQMLSTALHLGYIDNVVEALFSSLLAGDNRNLKLYQQTLEGLRFSEQANVLYSILRIVSNRLRNLDRTQSATSQPDSNLKVLQGVAALISDLTTDSEALSGHLSEWLISSKAACVDHGILLFRAVIAALARNQNHLKRVFERALAVFGDNLHIKHTPILQQEGSSSRPAMLVQVLIIQANTQILLIVAGYLYRADIPYMTQQSRSSVYINAISDRLSASSQRASLLGMLVGTAVSELVDTDGKRMKFSVEDIDSVDGKWYRSLVTTQDTVGSIGDLRVDAGLSKKPRAANTQTSNINIQKVKAFPGTEAKSRIIAIEEIDNATESEDEDLICYEKPDSDASDEDEDPTLVQRDRPTAPVYIRDLIAGLRDTQNFDRHKLALTHASGLIRRKANFGSEVSEHIEELATLLVGLGDSYNLEDFQQLRLKGMIAVLIAQPLKMGQWFSRTFFNGDYSVGQRASVLTTLSLGARELAGFQKEDYSLTGADGSPKNLFPSRMLPDKLHKTYAIEAKPVDDLSEQLEKCMIKPMAIEAAEQLSGPTALKVRRFSSRMAVEKKREKPIANSLAKIVGEAFVSPLTGLLRIHAQAYGDQTVLSSTFLLTLYLKTLSLILHAAGSTTSSLPQITAEVWDLLLSLRSRAADLPVLEALLFAFLTLLGVNENSQGRIAEEHGKELLETQEWVQMVFGRLGGGSEEDEKVRMLAAGVLTRTREVVEKQQRLLLGDLISYM